MSPLVITVILVFAAGIVGFFFGCLFARWLSGPSELAAAGTSSPQLDLAPTVTTPTALDPSTSVMTFKPAATSPAPPTPAVAAAATLAEKAASPARKPAPAPRPSPPPAAVPAPPATSTPPPASPAPAGDGPPSTAAGSAIPAATPLRGPLAVARATPKSAAREEKKAAKPRTRRKSAAKPAAKKPAKAATKPTPAAMSGETQAKKPRFLEKPRKAGADDLKRIKGVGPALEKTLNSLGVFHYNQVAKWTPENVMWVDDHLKFKGRIARDNWIDQAAKLDAGEVTEFAARVDKGAVASSRGKPQRSKA